MLVPPTSGRGHPAGSSTLLLEHPLLDGELLAGGEPAEVPHVGHQLVVLHPVVDVRDEHLHIKV